MTVHADPLRPHPARPTLARIVRSRLGRAAAAAVGLALGLHGGEASAATRTVSATLLPTAGCQMPGARGVLALTLDDATGDASGTLTVSGFAPVVSGAHYTFDAQSGALLVPGLEGYDAKKPDGVHAITGKFFNTQLTKLLAGGIAMTITGYATGCSNVDPTVAGLKGILIVAASPAVDAGIAPDAAPPPDAASPPPAGEDAAAPPLDGQDAGAGDASGGGESPSTPSVPAQPGSEAAPPADPDATSNSSEGADAESGGGCSSSGGGWRGLAPLVATGVALLAIGRRRRQRSK